MSNQKRAMRGSNATFLQQLREADTDAKVDALASKFVIIERRAATVAIIVVLSFLSVIGVSTYFTFKVQVASIAAEAARTTAEDVAKRESTRIAEDVARGEAQVTVTRVFDAAQRAAEAQARETAKQTAIAVAKDTVPGIVEDLARKVSSDELNRWVTPTVKQGLENAQRDASEAAERIQAEATRLLQSPADAEIQGLKTATENLQGAIMFLAECTLGRSNETDVPNLDLQKILSDHFSLGSSDMARSLHAQALLLVEKRRLEIKKR